MARTDAIPTKVSYRGTQGNGSRPTRYAPERTTDRHGETDGGRRLITRQYSNGHYGPLCALLYTLYEYSPDRAPRSPQTDCTLRSTRRKPQLRTASAQRPS